MNILVVATFFCPSIGGIETSALEFFARLKKAHPEITISILALNTHNAPTQEIMEGLHIYRMKAKQYMRVNPLFSPRELQRILNLKQQTQSIDLVITQCRYYFFTYAIALFAKKNALPHYHIEHNAGSYLYDIFFGRMVLVMADKILYVSEDVKKFCEQKFSIRKDSIVLSPGVDEVFWRNESATIRSGDDVTLVFVGRVIREKGIYILVDAMRKLISFKTLRLVVVGDGPELKNVMRLCRELHLDQRISFRGFLSPQGIKEVFQEADIFINPSYYPEGLQLTLLEAASFGLPIISTDVSGARDVITHEWSGLIIPKKNTSALVHAIEKLSGDPALRRMFADNIKRSTREDYSWDRALARMHAEVLKA